MIKTTDTQSKTGLSKKLAMKVVPALHARRDKKYSKPINSVTIHKIISIFINGSLFMPLNVNFVCFIFLASISSISH